MKRRPLPNDAYTAVMSPIQEQNPVSPGNEPTISAFTVLPLRLFLGLTFVYAGYQKVTDPGFFKPGTRTYIGTQILSFSRGSPIQAVMHQLMQFAVAVGLLTIATETIVGVLALLGLFTRVASIVGLVLNLVLFLSASWHTYPYFLGADIVFVVCWLTLALTGPGPFALDHAYRPRMYAVIAGWLGHPYARVLAPVLIGPPLAEPDHDAVRMGRRITRAEALVGGAVASALVILGLLPRGGSGAQTLAGGPTPGTGNSGTGAATPGGKSTSGSPSGSSSPRSGIPANAKEIGNISQLPRNAAGTVSDPGTGDPVVIVHLSDNRVVAYDAVCTHAGCTVQYDPQQKYLVCPCHGGAFDPAHDAQVVAGPPPTPLAKIDMKIDSRGNIYIV